MNDVYLIKKETLTNIRDAIWSNSPDTWVGEFMTPEQMSDAIYDVYDEGYDYGYEDAMFENRITDLTGTVWKILTGWSAEAGYGEFEIDADLYGDGITHSMTSLKVGYNVFGNANKDLIYFGGNTTGNMTGVVYNPNNNIMPFMFTGGADVTNTDLINWLYKYGSLQPYNVSYEKSYNKGYNEGYYDGQIVQYETVVSSSTFTITVINNTDLKLTTHINVWCEFNTETGLGDDYSDIIIEVEPWSSNSGSVTLGAGGSQHKYEYTITGMEFLYVA